FVSCSPCAATANSLLAIRACTLSLFSITVCRGGDDDAWLRLGRVRSRITPPRPCPRGWSAAGPLALERFPGALGLVMVQPGQRVRDLTLSIVELAVLPLVDLPVEHLSVEQMVLEAPVRILDEEEGGFAGV